MKARARAIGRKASMAGAVLALSLGLTARVYGEASPLAWRSVTQSPQPLGPDAHLDPLVAACGTPDAALTEVALRSAQRQLDGAALPGAEEFAFRLRAAGDPHVWPRAWSIAGQALDEEDTGRRVRAWIGASNTLGTPRCGLGRATGPDGTTVVTAVAVDVLADLAPLPITARVGQWLSLDGAMLVPTSDAKVILLGPRGAPRSIVASLSGRRVHAMFLVDQPGPWLVQVLATVATGPRPVLEAMVFAGTPPQTQFVSTAAPGEAESKGGSDDDDAMLRMINAARATEQRAPLVRDPNLDRLARAHSDEMRRVRMVGHNIGGGDLMERLQSAGIRVRMAGENCASARSPEHAHRAVWASPSHRGNLLLDQFTKVGISVVKSPDGTVWVTEMFAG